MPNHLLAPLRPFLKINQFESTCFIFCSWLCCTFCSSAVVWHTNLVCRTSKQINNKEITKPMNACVRRLHSSACQTPAFIRGGFFMRRVNAACTAWMRITHNCYDKSTKESVSPPSGLLLTCVLSASDPILHRIAGELNISLSLFIRKKKIRDVSALFSPLLFSSDENVQERVTHRRQDL